MWFDDLEVTGCYRDGGSGGPRRAQPHPGCSDGAEKDAVTFFLTKQLIEKRSAAPWRSVAAARAGPMCCAQSSGWHQPWGSAVESGRGQSSQFSPVCLTTSGWSPREARRCEGSPQAKLSLATKNRVYIPKTVTWRQIYFSPREIFCWVGNPARASGDWCRSPTWGSFARPIGTPKNPFSTKKKGVSRLTRKDLWDFLFHS